MPICPSSRAATRVRPRRPHLVGAYAASPFFADRPSTDDTFTIEPPPAACISRATAFIPRKGPSVFTRQSRSTTAAGVSTRASMWSRPALLTSTVGRPKRRIVSCTTFAQLASSVTSRRTKAARCADLGRRLLALLDQHVGDDDLRPLVGKEAGRLLAGAAGGSGHDGDLSLESGHTGSRRVRRWRGDSRGQTVGGRVPPRKRGR